MSAEVTLLRPAERLTRAQKALALSVPGCAERAARAVRLHFGSGGMPKEDLIQLGHFGIFRAAQLFDPGRGVPFEHWAFFKATHAIRDAIRRHRGRRGPLDAARIAAGSDFLASTPPAAVSNPFTGEKALREKLESLIEDQLIAELSGSAAAADSLSVEDRVHAQLDWGAACDALKQLYDELPPKVREVLRLHYVDDVSLKEVSQRVGWGYWGLLPEHQDTLRLLKARLRGLGICALPAQSSGMAGLGRLFEQAPMPENER